MRAARHPAQPHLLAIVLVTLPPLSMAAESARSVRLPPPVFFEGRPGFVKFSPKWL
jgi:hypothetical protein